MKYIILFCFILSSSLISAQSDTYNLDKEIEKVYLKYQMDDIQKSQVKILLTQKYNDLKQIGEMRISLEEKNQKRTELVETYDEAFVGLLNDKQKQLHKMYQQLGNPRMIKQGSATPGDIKGAPASKPRMEKSNQ